MNYVVPWWGWVLAGLAVLLLVLMAVDQFVIPIPFIRKLKVVGIGVVLFLLALFGISISQRPAKKKRVPVPEPPDPDEVYHADESLDETEIERQRPAVVDRDKPVPDRWRDL